MLMKPSSTLKKINRVKARNAAFLNLLATPGLGSLVARRWFAGTGQLTLAIVGFVIFCIPLFKILAQYYGLMFADTPPPPVKWVALFIVTGFGAGLFVLAWLWSLVTSLSLLREAPKANVPSVENFAAGQVKLDEAKIQIALAALTNWEKRGDAISRMFQFKDFPAAVEFVNAVAELAEEAQHHPDIDIRWNKVTLALTTHDAGGLTEKDFWLAKKCDELSLR
jgi:4a-hydroxytetrahydrobiopterin dehydratase